MFFMCTGCGGQPSSFQWIRGFHGEGESYQRWGGAGRGGGTQKILPLVLQLLFPDACHQHMVNKWPQASLRGSFPSQFILPTFLVPRGLSTCRGWQTFGNRCHYLGELSWQWVNTQDIRIKMLRMDLESLPGQYEEMRSFTLCEQHKG